MIRTTGKEKDYELVEYVNDVNREHVEVLMELNINGIMDTAYSYGTQRLTNERFTGFTGYYTYAPRGSVSGVTDDKGMIWQSYRYNANGDLTFGKPKYNNVYSYNGESYNPNMESQYLRARYYNVPHANFLTEDSYLGNITDPLTLNRYNYVKSSPLNYVDPSGHKQTSIYEGYESKTSPREQQVLSYQNDTKGRKSGETFFEWKIRLAKMSGTYNLCVRETTRSFLRQKGLDPDKERGAWEDFWFPSAIENKAIMERTNSYLRFLLDEERIPDTNETYQIRLTVYNILADVEMNGYSVKDVDNRYINEVYVNYLVEREGYAGLSTMLLLTVGSIAAQRAIENYWTGKTSSQGTRVEGGSKSPNDINYNSKQVGKKYGEHMKDYTAYKDYAGEIFKSPDQIIHDVKKGEYYYTKETTCLELKKMVILLVYIPV